MTPFLLLTSGFGGTLTEEDSMEKHLLPTLSKMTNHYFYSRRDICIDDTLHGGEVTSRCTRLQAISDTDSRATIEDSGCRHFVRECFPEDSIKAADQISDKEPEGVQNSSGAEYDTIVATPS